LEKLADAKAVLDQAKSKGAKGDGFDKLEQRLKEAGESSALDIAVQLRDSGEFNQAIDLLKDETNQFPEDADILALLSHCYLLADQVEEAKLHLEKATSIAPDSASVGWNIARLTLKEQKLLEALNVARDTSRRFPDNVEGMGVLGACLRANGEADESLEVLNKAIELNPDYAEALINRGLIRLSQENKPEALADLEVAHRLKPHIKQIWDLVVGLKVEAQEYSDAILLLINIIEIDPENEKRLATLALCYQHLKDFNSAIEAYNKALAIKPDYVEAHINLGSAFKEQGRLEEAIEAYNKALAIKPDYAEAYNNMGVALKEQGKLEEAIEAYNKALAIKPDYAEAYSNIGSALTEQGELEEAIEAYNKALAIKPDYAQAWLNGAEALEKWNKLKELGLWLERAFQILEPVPSDISFMKAKLLWRNKDTQKAIKLISNIDVETITPSRKQDYLNLKAKCYEASKDYDLAFNCFENMNSLTIKSNDYLGLNPERYFQNIRDQLASLNSNSLKNPASHITEQPDLVPVFLVGFPRSGTTLLDTILRSHSSIDVVEEQPAVNLANAFVKKSGYADIGQALPQEVLVGARKAYITELDKHREPIDNKSILIDKLPLNLLQIPLIQQLYPRAKFILALRHPLDTILSCWMQNFKLNSAMANMVDLDRIVEFYCVAMDIFKICRAKYNLNVHEIRYEDLLEDLSGETSALLKFLDLDWEDQMENYQKTALKRGRISTPSYSQVVQPIYKDAKYRWLNYKKHLRQYITQVEPWIDEFGYSNH
jgi:tetratricopeptide (TPR) repeat protein